MSTSSFQLTRRAFLKALLGNKDERIIGEFVLRRMATGTPTEGVGVFTKEQIEIQKQAEKEAVKIADKFLRKNYWESVDIKKKQVTLPQNHKPITDEELEMIE